MCLGDNVFLTASKVYFVARVMIKLIFDDCSLMYNNDAIIKIVFVRFVLPKVNITYFRDYSMPIAHLDIQSQTEN